MYVGDVVRMTETVTPEKQESCDEGLVDPTDNELFDPMVEEFVDQTTSECWGCIQINTARGGALVRSRPLWK